MDVALGVHVEGPNRCSPNDAATSYSKALERGVTIDVVPPERWIETFRHIGFSVAAAESYARITARTVGDVELAADPQRGPTLDAYAQSLVQRAASGER